MVRLVKAIGLAVPLLVIVTLLLASYSDSTQQKAANVIVRAAQIRDFLKMAPAKDKHCRLSDVWNYALNLDKAEARARWESTFKIVTSDKGLQLVATPDGNYWIPERDFSSLAEMLDDQKHEAYGDRVRGVHQGDIVLDCGANVGVYTRHALDRGAALVVSIEPAPENLECLRRNFSAEMAARRVLVYPKGVWDKDATLPMQANSAMSSLADTVVLGGDRTLAQVELTTIDKLVTELALPRVDMIKMDIEGAERQALAGARNTVERFRPRLAVAVEHYPGDIDSIPAVLAAQWPGIRMECGECEHVHNLKVNRIQPSVVFGRW